MWFGTGVTEVAALAGRDGAATAQPEEPTQAGSAKGDTNQQWTQRAAPCPCKRKQEAAGTDADPVEPAGSAEVQRDQEWEARDVDGW